jgi:hypothetical protein
VTELRLHRAVYTGVAVDEAVRVYATYAQIERAPEPEGEAPDAGHHVVRVTAATPKREQRVARELANYALGLTIAAHRH